MNYLSKCQWSSTPSRQPTGPIFSTNVKARFWPSGCSLLGILKWLHSLHFMKSLSVLGNNIVTDMKWELMPPRFTPVLVCSQVQHATQKWTWPPLPHCFSHGTATGCAEEMHYLCWCAQFFKTEPIAALQRNFKRQKQCKKRRLKLLLSPGQDHELKRTCKHPGSIKLPLHIWYKR